MGRGFDVCGSSAIYDVILVWTFVVWMIGGTLKCFWDMLGSHPLGIIPSLCLSNMNANGVSEPQY